ncbi:hypothetical protein INR49_010551 [Caranx melampygus]|nr:hypothetical protein INR49_010551 [Caranx melampygus]
MESNRKEGGREEREKERVGLVLRADPLTPFDHPQARGHLSRVVRGHFGIFTHWPQRCCYGYSAGRRMARSGVGEARGSLMFCGVTLVIIGLLPEGVYSKILPYIVFGTISIMAVVVIMLLPDTRDTTLPELISQTKPIRGYAEQCVLLLGPGTDCAVPPPLLPLLGPEPGNNAGSKVKESLTIGYR